MIGYVTLGTNDIEKAGKFYDELLALFGAKRWMEMDRLIAWGAAPGAPSVCATKPYDGGAASVGNGVMIALAADSREKVDEVYKKAIELGAQDEGEPGERMPNFYAGYFRDPDGNKLNVFHMTF